jgi:hypothetical protein
MPALQQQTSNVPAAQRITATPQQSVSRLNLPNAMTLAGLVPFVTAGQVYMYEHKKKPPFGGMRAGLTAATLLKEAIMKERKKRRLAAAVERSL